MNDNYNDNDTDQPETQQDETHVAPESPADAGARALEDALRQRDEFKDLLLRKTAEFENYRKRIDRERQMLSETAAAGVLEELLPIVDDLERALKVETGGEGADAYRRGVELIQRQLDEVLRKRGVRPVDALGADFDPHYHQSVSHEPAEGRRDGEIIEEFRRGYLLGDRLLRPSMVKVAKG
ncbi:MAG TPA: nucleotide exchange factor GrpE [Vicinamibacterales bacterium]|nr:nucleotide exchange factor GrpE [Vicinamibacterales bacterium]